MTPAKTKYVVGFLFDKNFRHVVLIQKLRPQWQEGKLNGPGGKIEPGETAEEAIEREFLEETGFDILNWRRFATLEDLRGHTVEFLYGVVTWPIMSKIDNSLHAAPIVNDVERASVKEVAAIWENLPVIPNLRWLIPLAITIAKSEEPIAHFTITEDCT